MTLKQVSDGGVVLTYNITNERGWNDPPTNVFSPGTSGNRKRIDPRKRVAHNVNSAGFTQSHKTVKPFNNTNNTMPNNLPHALPNSMPNGMPMHNGYTQPYAPQTSPLNQQFQNMNLATHPKPMQHASSNPDLSNMQQFGGNNIQHPPPIHHAASVPFNMNRNVDSPICNTGTYTPPYNLNTPNNMNNGSLTPPTDSAPRKLSAPNTGYTSAANSIFDKMATPMLQSSHLKNNVQSVNDSPPPGMMSQQQPSSLPPMLTTQINNQANLYARSISTPSVPQQQQRQSPTNVFMAPPPTAGFYAGKNLDTSYSPKSLSPGSSGKNSPVPPSLVNAPIENDLLLLESTLKRLNSCKSKCSCYLSNKVGDDISKRIKTFETKWRNNKLSNPVKTNMSHLAQALEKSEFLQADNIHKSLICEYSGEVMPWMVGIKKLISTYQQAVVENNRYQ